MKRKIFTLALCAFLIVTSIPTTSLTANAPYDIVLCGVFGDMVGGY